MAESLAAESLGFNREGWQFQYELRQQDLYQRQKMRVKQVELYREDLRHLFGLTIGKMDNYTIVSSLMLGITMEMFYKGRMPQSSPPWLFWCWAVTTAAAMYYFLLSLWLALHASIFSQTFSVRALTQWLRLPIPSAREVQEGCAKLEDFEKEKLGGIFRVPILQSDRLAEREKAEASEEIARHDLATEWDLFQRHFLLFNKLHQKWQGHEAYARVCMSLGINQLFSSLSYFALSYYNIYYGVAWSGWAFVVMFQTCSMVHGNLTFNLSRKSHYIMVSLLLLPALLMSIAVALYQVSSKTNTLAVTVMSALSMLAHCMWCIFFLFKTWGDKNGLPVKFSTVWCIDVLGFGLTTLTEVQEPRAVNPLRQVQSFLQGGPSNTFLKEDVPEPEVSEELRKVCKRVEGTLQGLFKKWQDSEQSTDERIKLRELKKRFEQDRKDLAVALKVEKGKGDAVPGSLFLPSESWVRLYMTNEEEGPTTVKPYYLNVQTGEIRWDPPPQEEDSTIIRRGPSLVPEQLAIYEAQAKALEEAEREKMVSRPPESSHSKARNQIPFMLFKYGTAVIMVTWLGAIVDVWYTYANS